MNEVLDICACTTLTAYMYQWQLWQAYSRVSECVAHADMLMKADSVQVACMHTRSSHACMRMHARWCLIDVQRALHVVLGVRAFVYRSCDVLCIKLPGIEASAATDACVRSWF